MRTLMRFLIVLAVPVVLIVAGIRAVTLPWFPTWEYARPGFPADPYGMPPTERLALAHTCIAFLNLPHDTALLAALRLPDGSPAFNARELSHMDDVKEVYDRVTTWAAFALVVAAAAAWALHLHGDHASIWGGLSNGGLLTLLLFLVLGLLMVLAWRSFFVGLHGVFFEGDSWLFEYFDTLIRLFPERFWQDAGLLIAGAVSAVAFALAFVGRVIQRRLEGAV